MRGDLPEHVINQLNAHDDDKRQAVLQATIEARLDERRKYQHELKAADDCVRVVGLLRYSARDCGYVVDEVSLVAAGIDIKRLRKEIA